MHSRTLLARISALLSFAVGASAKDQQAVCPFGWSWNENSLGQDPCTVASIIQAYCRNDSTFSYQAITVGNWYSPPSNTNRGDQLCACDTVIYSLVMACGTCQQGDAYGWIAWSAQCNNIVVANLMSYIPQGTAVPFWAFSDVTTLNNEQFDNGNAQTIGRNPEAMPDAPPRPTPSPIKSKSKSISKKTAGIIGGVVGVIGFLIIAIVAYFSYRWWRENEEEKPPVQRDDEAVYDARLKPHLPTNHGPDAPTEQTLAPNRLFHLYAPFSTQAEREANRKATWVTPM